MFLVDCRYRRYHTNPRIDSAANGGDLDDVDLVDGVNTLPARPYPRGPLGPCRPCRPSWSYSPKSSFSSSAACEKSGDNQVGPGFDEAGAFLRIQAVTANLVGGDAARDAASLAALAQLDRTIAEHGQFRSA